MPRYLPTGSGLQTKGRFSKYFEPSSMGTVMLVFLLSMLMTYVLVFIRGYSLVLVIPCVLLAPNIATLYVIFALVQGKPRGHLSDWIRLHFKGHESAHVRHTDPRFPRLDLDL
jgi:hypothetical protein